MPTITEFAPAKLNLYLHITGRRNDGYHDLDSLVTFVDIGDKITLQEAPEFNFSILGPYAPLLKDEPAENNLAIRAARSLAALVGRPLVCSLTLTKNLPIASGIGGGSSDAAATLRVLAKFWDLAPNDPRLFEAARQHGQDVPSCLTLKNNYLTANGIGSATPLPKAGIVLVNPNKALSTPEVYKGFRTGNYGSTVASPLKKQPNDVQELVRELSARHNDLFAPASWLVPEIQTITSALEQSKDCLLARMSGSGATCFGIYKDKETATAAASQLRLSHPNWWVAEGTTYSLDEI